MMTHQRRRIILTRSIFTSLIFLGIEPAFAAGSGMPWEGPLNQVLASIESEVTKVIAVIIIAMTGLAIAQGEMGNSMKRFLQIVFGISVAFAGSSFFLTFFSFGGGALI